MPSRQVGNLAVAAAFALFAVFLFCARDKNGAWRPNPLCVSLTSTEDASTTTVSMAGSKHGKTKSKEGAPRPLSNEIKDAATGLSLPRTKRFTKSDLTCLGVGVRAKSIAIAKVNVYTVGLYVEARGARGALKKVKDDASLFKVLGQAGGFNKYLHLVFARSVGAQKVVDALTSVKGVHEDVITRFSTMILDAVGGSIGKGETISLGWEGKDKMVVIVRDKPVGTVVDAALPKAVFDLYLGSQPVSPAAKAAFAEGVPALLGT